MGQELLKESLSAVMDGEADELELRRVLSAVGDDEELRQRWQRYQLASAALRRQVVQPDLDLASRVSAAIAAEEQVAAPAAAAVRGSSFLRLAVAAGVTCAVLVGARFYGVQQESVEAGLASQQPVPTINVVPVRPGGELGAPAVLASYPGADGKPQAPVRVVPEDNGQILRQLPSEGANAARQ